jgi:hypothetical protein
LKKSRQKWRFRPIPRQFAQQFQWLAGKFPEAERTGNFSAGTGNFFDGTGNFPMEQGIATLTGLAHCPSWF